MRARASLREQYRQFADLVGRTIAAQPMLFGGFVTLSLAAALSEGLGVSLVIPLLQWGAEVSTAGRIPWLDSLLAALLPLDPAARTAVLAAVLAGVILARGLLQVGASYLSIILPLRVQSRLSNASYDNVLKTSLDFFVQSDGGVMRTLVQEYPQRLASSIKAVTDALGAALLAAIYIVLMLWISWSMTLLTVVLIAIAGLTFEFALRFPLGRTGEALSRWQERWNTLIHETALGLKLIRLLGAESTMRIAYQEAIRNCLRFDAKRQLIGEAQSPLLTTLGGLLVCGMLIYGAFMERDVDTASLLVLVLCLYRLTAPASRILSNLVTIKTNLDALDRQEMFARKMVDATSPDGRRQFTRLREGVRFADVGFRYPGADRFALDGVDLSVRRGEMVALVGPSGSGKTTLVNLLGRLYDPQRGRIEIDGVDLRDYEIGSWRHRIAVVTQDITLFNMSVAENLTFGLEGVTREALDRAAEHAAAKTFIMELPEGWDTRLGDRGARLSGGQQQRLSIARAVLRDPELLIFDEATSQLDSLTEQAIQRMIDSYRRDRTILVVAHRLSTVRRADRVAVMRNGRIVELGSHDELAAQNGHYRAMLDAQQLDLAPEPAA
ncbi:MAG TPA: ABC transporter ATP-binding protein [Xanthobacteraceae bacterium]|nr:ABC transporter ATP-binding protein [Xanthobacteraceae bacterium]